MSEYLTAENLLLSALVYLFLCGFAGVYVANQKGREPWEGFLLAALFGPLGLVVAACLPAIEAARADDRTDEEDDGELRAKLAAIAAPPTRPGLTGPGGPPPIVGRAARKLLGEVEE